MAKIGLFLLIGILVLLAACAGEESADSSKESTSDDSHVTAEGGDYMGAPTEPSVMGVPAQAPPIPAPFSELDGMGEAPALSGSILDNAQRKVISMASVSIEVEVVDFAVTEVQAIAESLGGFVEQLSSSGEAESERANITIRIPQAQFFPALERIASIGEIQSRNVGSEDVSEQFIDLEARLKSSIREEQSLISLLERADTVGEILAIERELSRVRSEIERFQGQLNFLERRVDLATISIHIFPPKEHISAPPFASLTIEVSGVTGSVNEIRALASSLSGVLDRVFLSIRDGNERADLSLRVFTPDFKQALASIESQGSIQIKELQETTNQVGDETSRAEDPDAQINVVLIEKTGRGVMLPVVASLGGVGIVAVLGFLFYLTYRAGRRRALQNRV